MKKKSLVTIVLIITVYFLTYLTSTIYQSTLWGDILSPVGALISSVLIFSTYIKSKRKHFVYYTWLLYGLASLTWAVADILWAYMELVLGGDPNDNVLINSVYSITSVFFLISVVLYSVYQYKKWTRVKLVLDMLVITIASTYSFWVVFFNRNFNPASLIAENGIVTAACIAMDIATFVFIAIWYLSIRSGSIGILRRLVSAGICLFVLVDLYYYYTFVYDIYIPNSIIDAIYMASFLLIAFAGAWEQYGHKSQVHIKKDKRAHNFGLKNKGLLITICPILMAVNGEVKIFDIVFFAFLIVVYEWLCTYINSSVQNEKLLKMEKEINMDLGSLVEARTRELEEQNNRLEQVNQELNFLLNQDPMTKLHNSRYFLNKINEKIEILLPEETLLQFYLDVDRFKIINDTYGHAMGNKILREIAARLMNTYGNVAVIARFSGDEFSLFFSGQYDYESAVQLGNEILACCGGKMIVEEYIFNITISCGVSIYPLDAHSYEDMLKNSEIAMFRAKSKGYNYCCAFDGVTDKETRRRHTLEYMLNNAVIEDDFDVFFQPQFLIDGELIGAEALVRWKSPGGGYIMPGEFIPLAEETNHIIRIGEWVMNEAVNQVAYWNDTYGRNLKMGVNISPRQLCCTTFAEKFKDVVNNKLPNKDWIDVEITEGIALQGENSIEKFLLFKSLGITISVDDFGTGYSSLSYLKRFQFDRIKIAKELVDFIETDSFDRNIIGAIISLAKVIGIKTIAEGVENREQLDILKHLGCEEVQGYYFGKPIPAAEFETEYLK